MIKMSHQEEQKRIDSIRMLFIISIVTLTGMVLMMISVFKSEDASSFSKMVSDPLFLWGLLLTALSMLLFFVPIFLRSRQPQLNQRTIRNMNNINNLTIFDERYMEGRDQKRYMVQIGDTGLNDSRCIVSVSADSREDAIEQTKKHIIDESNLPCNQI